MYLRPWERLVGPDDVVRGTLLVLAPHPDDEVIGSGGLIAMHRDRGAEVHVAVMTDGGRGDPTGALSGGAYTRLRREETREAARRIGGFEAVFFDHRDGALAAARTAVDDLALLLARVKPATLVFPSPFELHPDHRATALHAHAALKRGAAPPQILVCEIGGFMPANMLLHVTPWMARKEAAIGAYASQLAHQDVIAKVRALNRARTVNVDDASIEFVEAYARLAPDRLDAYFAAAEATVRAVDDADSPAT